MRAICHLDLASIRLPESISSWRKTFLIRYPLRRSSNTCPDQLNLRPVLQPFSLFAARRSDGIDARSSKRWNVAGHNSHNHEKKADA
jgi:hypothetical protein